MFGNSQKKQYIDFELFLKNYDQAELFRKYTNLNPDGFNYSIFRSDRSPGCRFKWYNGLLYYIDNATYKGKLAWSTIDVIAEIKHISKLDAAYLISKENGQNVNSLNFTRHDVIKPKLRINFEKDTWEKHNYLMINPEILEYENVFKVKNYWIDNGNGYVQNSIYNPRVNLTIAYYFPETNNVKLYFPGQQFRFFTNCSPEDVYRNIQLNYPKETCIITKSNKDRLLLKYLYGYESIAPQSENQNISLKHIEDVKKFKNPVIIYDSDPTGITFSTSLSEKHNIKNIILELGKDVYDITVKYGKENITKYLDSILK